MEAMGGADWHSYKMCGLCCINMNELGKKAKFEHYSNSKPLRQDETE